ncbi:putative DNA helicase chromatin remodeling SNF2 family [Helianthus annuus]|uniref:DNA helicase chromatin remodeling SNF2 family n=1 Tax=Helianthus annuus TaxID=4232 RepID=A0A9K3EFM1_HELAN|nr:helicase-like transcription factor CHR28 [Helianthus annuus]XP_035837477.1 helicase-like transcription factor CHR28 [Helianthus annuus]XP_035837478.1 helicase-like transcription factor CHR28 [Helianthus annuus]XP_035837479.1 helicase-like transcription factor CHR28 [Helianthus annuus]KAF5772220.1 putative DNA helicase chromatin remodeling SNF2 family [Helianthus annuus]KAJ0496658.1 putative DNA helicase chromatin remodeling SNF2 family [Helianthus annuus]
MEPILVDSSTDSESSDWDLEQYKNYKSPERDSATSAPNSSVISTFASSSGTSNAGHHGSSQRAPIRKPSINGHSSDVNYDLDRQLQIILSSSENFENSKRKLPQSLQTSSSGSRPSVRAKSVGTSQNHETFYDNEWQNLVKMGENSSRANNDLMKENHHGSRVLPPSMRSLMPVPKPQAGDVDEQAVGDERQILQVALQDFTQSKKEANLPDGILSVSLLRHQKIALAWMIQNENRIVACSGGILADDQGLGKTISTIALIQYHKLSSKPKPDGSNASKAEALSLDDDDVKPTVVVDADQNDESVITESGSSTQRFSNRKPTAGSLVVCPASVLRQWARELDEKVTEEAKLEVLVYHGGNRTKDPAELARYDVVLTTYAIVAKEVPTKVFDEEDEDDQGNGGFNAIFANKKRKGNSGKKKKGKKGIDGSVIDCSGTLAKVSWLRVILDEAQTIKNSRTQMSKSCCGLKAKKRWCLSGTPIQNNIDELFSYFRFLRCDPYAKYKSFCNQIKIPISRNSMQGYLKLQAVLKAIMLRRTKDTLIDGKPIIDLPPKTIKLTAVDFSPEERAFYQKLETESRSRFKAYAAAGTVSQNYANILLMLLRLRQACDHPLLVKGFTSESVSRLSTRMARNLPIDMRANLLNLLETLNICCLCSDPPEDAVVTICEHVFCYQCVSEHLTGDDNTCPSPKCKSTIGPDVVFNKATLRNSISDDNGASSSRIDEKSIVLQRDYTSSKIKAAIEIIRKNCRTRSSYLGGRNGDASSSSGVEGPIKAIVFSQWTRMLDLFEMSLNQYSIEYRRLDGSMSLSSRDRAVKQFNTDPEVTVMLMSLKAGNLGLNMVAASHVILFDLWWNPTTEDQAIDRAHRIGQTRAVTVSRLTVKDTVEDRILALQDEKRKMVASAFGEDQGGMSAPRLTAEDLRYLFMGGR